MRKNLTDIPIMYSLDPESEKSPVGPPQPAKIPAMLLKTGLGEKGTAMDARWNNKARDGQ